MVRRKRVTRRFPLHSPNWIPIVNALQSLCDLTRNAVLLEPDGELLPAAYWTEHQVHSWSWDVVPSRGSFVPSRGNMFTEITGYAYFVWKPALAKIWPAAFALAAAPAAPRVRRTNDKRQPKGSPTQDAIRQIAAQGWPDGHEGIPIKPIIAGVSPKLSARGIPVPKRDTWLRALGRRKS